MSSAMVTVLRWKKIWNCSRHTLFDARMMSNRFLTDAMRSWTRADNDGLGYSPACPASKLSSGILAIQEAPSETELHVRGKQRRSNPPGAPVLSTGYMNYSRELNGRPDPTIAT